MQVTREGNYQKYVTEIGLALLQPFPLYSSQDRAQRNKNDVHLSTNSRSRNLFYIFKWEAVIYSHVDGVWFCGMWSKIEHKRSMNDAQKNLVKICYGYSLPSLPRRSRHMGTTRVLTFGHKWNTTRNKNNVFPDHGEGGLWSCISFCT